MKEIAAAVIRRDGRLLLCRRAERPGDSCAGLWEFPGGKLEPGETPAQCLERELMEELELDPELIHACMSHGWGITVDVKPEQTMEKVLYATDELTGLIGAAAQMRPSRSVDDMELKSLKKKYKANGFAAGCSREVIGRGAELLGWELDELLTRTLDAMKSLPEELRTF